MSATGRSGPVEILPMKDNPYDVTLTVEALNKGRLWNNLLVQFSVISFAVMVALAVIISTILTGRLNHGVSLLQDHGVAMMSGTIIKPSAPHSIPSLSSDVQNLRWVTYGVVGGAFAFLYLGLVAIVWRGWRTIIRQRTALSIANKALEQRAKDLSTANERLERQTEELARSNEDLEQFAYAASHDLQEPLRAISGFTKLLARRYQGQSERDPDNLVARTINAADRMQAAMNDLIIYSRVGRIVERVEPEDTGAIVEQVITDLGASIEEASAVVTHDSLPTVMANKSLLGQVYGNLIGNAIKFHGEEPPRVHVSAELVGKEWVLSVRDNGMGIDSQYAERVFVIFQRLHTRDEYPGTGIGLAICKKAVERLGGRIWVDSEPGAGSTFYFTVPVGDGFEAGLTSTAPLPTAGSLTEGGSM